MKFHEAIKERIIFYCNERHITLNKLCTMSGIIQSTVNCIFTGKSKNPTVGTIRNLCTGLNITLSEFFNSELFNDIDDD